MTRLELRKVKQVRKIDLADKPLTVGRSSASDIVLDNTHVSRKHCVVELRNGSPYVRDLGSHGGTFVNGKRVGEAALAPGDRVSIGPFDLVFKDGSHTASKGDTDFGLLAPEDSSGGTSVPLAASNGQHLASGGAAPAIIHREVSFGPSIVEAAPATAELDERMAELDRRAAKLAEREAELEARQQDENHKSEARINDLLEQVAALAREHSQLQEAHESALAHSQQAVQELNQSRQRADELEAQAAAQASRVEHLTEANRRAADQLSAQQAAAQREADQLRRELAAAQSQVEQLRVHEQTLQQQVDALEGSRRIASERAEGSMRTLAMVNDQIQTLDDAARQIAALQNRLAQIESAWVQVDQQLQDTSDDDAELLESVATQQQEISAELDSLSQLRDEAVNRLSQSAQQLRMLAQHSTRAMAASLSSAQALSVSPSRAGKRWWKFGK